MAELRPRVVREAGGRVALRMGARERAILGALLGELRELVAEAGPVPDQEPALDPAVARLYPVAIPGDPEADAAFRDLTRADLEHTRRARLGVVTATLDAGSLDEAQAAAWLGVLNDLRLVLGTRLGVSEESEEAPIDEQDPDSERRIVYAYLGWLESQFVDVLAAALPQVTEPGEDPPAAPPGAEGAGPGDH